MKGNKERHKKRKIKMGNRKVFYEQRGYAAEEIERKREGWSSLDEMERRDRDIQLQERGRKIRESRYNVWYREIAESRRPEYLERRGKEKSMIRIARFRLGNEMRSARYWETEEMKHCRICEAEDETWEHVLERCTRGGGDNVKEGIGEKVKRILSGRGDGEKWMRDRRQKRKTECKDRIGLSGIEFGRFWCG